MKHSMRISFLFVSVCLLAGTGFVVATAQVEQEKLAQKKLDPEKPEQATREIDMSEIFGNPDELGVGESVRSVSKPLPAWKLYCMSWGAWIAVRCETALTYMKKRIVALMGLLHASKKEEPRKA